MLSNLLSWKLLSLVLVLVFLIQAFYLFGPLHESEFASPGGYQDEQHTPVEQKLEKATFSADECILVFPDLYHNIDHLSDHWKSTKHTISAADIEIGWRQDAAFRILVHDNELRILETKGTWANEGYRVRTRSVLNQINRALIAASAIGERVPTFEAAITVDDMSLIPSEGKHDTHTIWTFTSRYGDREWLIPDFNFYSAPPVAGSFADFQRKAMQHQSPFTKKTPKAVWRGVAWTNEAIRRPLLTVTNGTSWADVAEVDWETKSNLMSMEEMCKYAFFVHTEGRSYSGRLEFLLMCDSIPIIHDMDWTTHYQHLLVPSGPGQNCVRVERDFSDLEEKVKYYLAHPEEASRIIDQSIKTFRARYLSQAAESCYWRRLFEVWHSRSFKPNPFIKGSGGQLRGMSFEEFVHLQGEYPEETPK